MIINEVGAVWRKRASCDATKADDGGATRACCSPVPRAAATRARRCGCGGRRQASGGRARWALASQPAVRASGLPRQNLRRRSASAAGGPASLPGPTAGHTSDIVPVRALERVRDAGRRLDAGPQNDVASEVGRAGGATVARHDSQALRHVTDGVDRRPPPTSRGRGRRSRPSARRVGGHTQNHSVAEGPPPARQARGGARGATATRARRSRRRSVASCGGRARRWPA
jgi:hypothetical protein